MPQLTPAAASADTLPVDVPIPAGLPTVIGALRMPGGECSLDGARVLLEPLTRTTQSSGSPLQEIASGVTDDAGRFQLTVPTTPELVEEARRNGGTLNVALLADSETGANGSQPDLCTPEEPRPVPTVEDPHDALQDLVNEPDLTPVTDALNQPDTSAVTAQTERRPVYFINYAFSLDLLNTHDGDEAMVFAPVNVGTLLLGEYVTRYGGAFIDPVPQPTSSPQPQDALLPVDATDAAIVPGVSAPVPQGAGQAAPDADASDAMPHDDQIESNPTFSQPSEGGAYDPYERCQQPENYNRTFADNLGESTEPQPVGELHTSGDMTGVYDYGRTAHTELGVGVTHDGKWKVSGGVKIKNETSARAIANVGANFGAHIMSAFRFRKERITHCGTSCCSSNDPQPYVFLRVRSLYWQGGATAGPVDLTAWDNANQLNKATQEGRENKFSRGYEFVRTSTKSHKYTFESTAFGVQLSAESFTSTETEHRVKMGTSKSHYWLWGNNGPPGSPATTIVYAYSS